MLCQKQSIGDNLHRISFLGAAFAALVTTCRTLLVIDDFSTFAPVFDDIDNAYQAEGIAFQLEASQRGTIGQIQFGWVFKTRRRINIAMRPTTFNSVGVVKKDVFDPLIIKQARAIYIVVKTSNRQRRLPNAFIHDLNGDIRHGVLAFWLEFMR